MIRRELFCDSQTLAIAPERLRPITIVNQRIAERAVTFLGEEASPFRVGRISGGKLSAYRKTLAMHLGCFLILAVEGQSKADHVVTACQGRLPPRVIGLLAHTKPSSRTRAFSPAATPRSL